jgi:diketogulonate reductase-like aldo/keto reductase
VECHPGWQQSKLHSFCQSTGVHLSVSLLCNYIFLPVKVLASGGHAFAFWKTLCLCLQFRFCILQAYSPLGSPGTTWMNGNVLKEPVVISIAEKLGKTPAQVALRWNIQMGHSVLPKSVSEERMKQNLDVYDWSISEDLLAKFSEIKQVRYATLCWHLSSTSRCSVF